MEVYHKKEEPFMFLSTVYIVNSMEEALSKFRETQELVPITVKKGNLRAILHYDFPGEKKKIEIGYPVSQYIELDGFQCAHTIYNEYLCLFDSGEEDTTRRIYQKMYERGVSPGMSLVTKFHSDGTKEILASVHLWTYLFKNALNKFIPNHAEIIYGDGDKLTPLSDISERQGYVTQALFRLKQYSDEKTQFEILSNIALTRPKEEIEIYKQIYNKSGDIQEVIKKREESQYWVIKPRIEGNSIITSKTPRNVEGYKNATTPEEKRKNYCFCILTAMSENPQYDPIFCYRAAGWARQLWEGILDQKAHSCNIRKSVLKGDEHCEFELIFPSLE